MKTFEYPEVEILNISEADVIVTSDPNGTPEF